MLLDKRDKKGQLLGFSLSPTAYKVSEICLESFKKNKELFNFLNSVFPKKLIDLYFQKLFFELAFDVAYKIVLNEKKIYTDFPLVELLQKKDQFSEIEFIKIKKKKNLKKSLRNFLINNLNNLILLNDKILKIYFKIFKKFDDKKIAKIAVNFVEGVSKNKRSDFFWHDKNSFSQNVYTYIESQDRINKLYNSKNFLAGVLNEENISKLSLYNPIYFQSEKKIEEIRVKINNLKFNDNFNFMKTHINIMLTKIQFWFFFFKENNIKIHINSEESGLSNIIRQISLKMFNGCSIGKLKSYPTNIKEDYMGYFPNDIYFTWGKESTSRLKNTYNCIKYFIISGDPYPNIDKAKQTNFEIKINKLKNRGKENLIMLIDSVYSENKDINWHLIYKEKMKLFFEEFLKLQSNNNKIGLIIKSKKKNNLKGLGAIYDKIKNLNDQNECILIEENNDLTSHYSNYVSMIVSFSTYIQGAFIQALVKDYNKRGLIFDDTNLTILEKKIYEFGKDKVIFNDLNKMISEISIFYKKKDPENKLGLWKNLDEFDPFGDYSGGQRIGIFIKTLLENFNSKKNAEESIKNALKHYSNLYGENKIYEA